MKDSLGAKHQRAMKDSLSAKPQRATSDVFKSKTSWSREKHIKLVNIIGKPLAGITARSRIKDLEAASAHECLYVNFLFEMEPKKRIKALEEEEGWIIAIQEKLNQFEMNKVWTLVPKPHGIRLSVEDPLSARLNGIEGLAECKASAINLSRIQVKYIVKEVKDNLKTYSSAGMDISWYIE
ncbi:hypothetical protein Tco_0407009 [Tanacetum coccineum]